MAAYQIATFDFVRWDGSPPPLVKEHVATFNKIGQAGISAQRTGIHGDPFEATLSAVFATKNDMLVETESYRDLIGATPSQVVYDDTNLFFLYSHLYLVTAVDTVSTKTHPRLVGPGYDLLGGWLVKTRWQMVPIRP